MQRIRRPDEQVSVLTARQPVVIALGSPDRVTSFQQCTEFQRAHPSTDLLRLRWRPTGPDEKWISTEPVQQYAEALHRRRNHWFLTVDTNESVEPVADSRSTVTFVAVRYPWPPNEQAVCGRDEMQAILDSRRQLLSESGRPLARVKSARSVREVNERQSLRRRFRADGICLAATRVDSHVGRGLAVMSHRRRRFMRSIGRSVIDVDSQIDACDRAHRLDASDRRDATPLFRRTSAQAGEHRHGGFSCRVRATLRRACLEWADTQRSTPPACRFRCANREPSPNRPSLPG